MSTWGTLFRVTTFGESHCKGVGCIIDGCPPNMGLVEADIQPQLTRRRPGQSKLTTPRSEGDIVTIMSGTENGVTLGTSIGLFVPNENVRPGDYKEMNMVPRPGHADYTYQLKYGIRAASGGGRASARETIGRVAAGAVAEKWLRETYGTEIVAFVTSVGDVKLPKEHWKHPSGRPWTREEVDTCGTIQLIRCQASGWKKVAADDKKAQAALDAIDDDYFVQNVLNKDATVPCYKDTEDNVYNWNGEKLAVSVDSVAALLSDDVVPVRCPHAPTAARISSLVRDIKSQSDSIGGTVSCVCSGVPVGLGEPVFDKLEAKLAHAMLSLPATKGFEIGSGFEGTKMKGSEHNDMFASSTSNNNLLGTASNHAGGTLGGMSSGADIYFTVAVKPVSTIGKAQQTVDFLGNSTVLEAKGRHDPCVLPRTPPLLEAMTSLVLIDAAMVQRARVGPGELSKAKTFLDGELNPAKRQKRK